MITRSIRRRYKMKGDMKNKNAAPAEVSTRKKSKFEKFIDMVEVVGNKLPNPFLMFVYLSVILLVLSFVLNKLGVSVTYVEASRVAGEAGEEVTVVVRNLLEAEYIREFLINFVDTYITFQTLGLVMVMLMGIGFVQELGFFDALMKRTLLGVPAVTVTFVLAIAGVCANIASTAGIVFATSIGAALFAAMGRNPILGAVAGYASGHGGFSANLMIAGTDVMLSGITGSVVESNGLDAAYHPLCNWYFMIAATFVVAVCVTLVTEKFMNRSCKIEADTSNVDVNSKEVTDDEKRGLKWALIAFVAYVALILVLTVPSNGMLRSETGALLPESPFIDSIIALLFFLFMIVGIAYGYGARIIKNNNQIPKYMASGLRDSLSFFVVMLSACFFIEFFADSNITNIIAVNGANLLQACGLQGIPLAIAFLILCGFLNMFLTNSIPKWLILAPIFVPMFASVGFAPALTQVIFRCGDSATNPISPINAFIPMLIATMDRYKKDKNLNIGLGDVLSMTIPYSIALFIGMALLICVWMIFGLPLGPGAPIKI